MKKIIYALLFLFLLSIIFYFREDLYNFYYDYFVPVEKKVSTLEKNAYYRDYNWNYVQNTDNFIPSNKQDILNIYYTVANSGMTKFTFYCPKTYENCFNDVNAIANDQNTISSINNFIHPYNSFEYIKTETNSSGKIVIETEKVYNEEMIIILNYKVDDIIQNLIKDNDDNKNKIKTIHDYIINNTKYDKDRSDKKIIKYKSDTAYGVLIEKYGLCGGYTDAMMLFLEKFNIKSNKISSQNHIWNYVYVDDKWLHLDLTWDDPISSNGQDILDDTFFLIDDKTLKDIKTGEHDYNSNIYQN